LGHDSAPQAVPASQDSEGGAASSAAAAVAAAPGAVPHTLDAAGTDALNSAAEVFASPVVLFLHQRSRQHFMKCFPQQYYLHVAQVR